jgi:hypothetical protein
MRFGGGVVEMSVNAAQLSSICEKVNQVIDLIVVNLGAGVTQQGGLFNSILWKLLGKVK